MSRPGVGVGVIVVRDGKVLLMRRHGSHGAGTWAPPGGYLEFGEAPETCAVRETMEETGVEVADVRFVAITNDVYVEGKHHITVWMQARHVAGEGVLASPDEASAVGWFAWDALPAPLFLSFQHLVDGQCHPRGAISAARSESR